MFVVDEVEVPVNVKIGEGNGKIRNECEIKFSAIVRELKHPILKSS